MVKWLPVDLIFSNGSHKFSVKMVPLVLVLSFVCYLVLLGYYFYILNVKKSMTLSLFYSQHDLKRTQ